jgi:hypothetical protein
MLTLVHLPVLSHNSPSTNTGLQPPRPPLNFRSMTSRPSFQFALLCAAAFSLALPARSQLLDDNNRDAVRVTVAINDDGSRTVYEFNSDHHRATATTTSANGKPMGKVLYQIDDAGRFSSAVFFGPDKKFRFKSIYKYGNGGRLEEETHLGKDDVLVNKIVYKYDKTGKRTGYSVFDASGKLIGTTSSPSRSKKAKPHSRLIR